MTEEKTLDEVYTQRNVLAQLFAVKSGFVCCIRQKYTEWPVLVVHLDSHTELAFHIPKKDWNQRLFECLPAPESCRWRPDDPLQTWEGAQPAIKKLIDPPLTSHRHGSP